MLILTLLLILFLIILDRKLAKWSLKSLFSLTPPVLSLSTFYFLAWVPSVICWSAVYCIKSSTANVNLRNVSVIYVYNNTTSMTLGGNFTFAFRYLTNSLTPAFFLHKFYNSGVFMLRTPGVRIFTVSPFGAKA